MLFSLPPWFPSRCHPSLGLDPLSPGYLGDATFPDVQSPFLSFICFAAPLTSCLVCPMIIIFFMIPILPHLHFLHLTHPVSAVTPSPPPSLLVPTAGVLVPYPRHPLLSSSYTVGTVPSMLHSPGSHSRLYQDFLCKSNLTQSPFQLITFTSSEAVLRKINYITDLKNNYIMQNESCRVVISP